MKRLGFAILALALAGCASGLAQESGAAAPGPNLEAGRHIAETRCATCHAIGAQGASHHPMAPPFRTLSRDYPVNALEEAFAEGILVGHPDMPEFRFEPAQIDDLLAYIESVQERRGG